MTVAELIEFLATQDPRALVVVHDPQAPSPIRELQPRDITRRVVRYPHPDRGPKLVDEGAPNALFLGVS